MNQPFLRHPIKDTPDEIPLLKYDYLGLYYNGAQSKRKRSEVIFQIIAQCADSDFTWATGKVPR